MINVTQKLIALLLAPFRWFLKDSAMSDTPVAPAVTPATGDPYLDTFNAFVDEAVLLCPSDWADRQIRKAQGFVVGKWAVIGPQVHAMFATIPDKAIGFIDAILKAASLAATGHPLGQAALNIARGFIDAVWDDIFPKAQATLAAKGIKV